MEKYDWLDLYLKNQLDQLNSDLILTDSLDQFK